MQYKHKLLLSILLRVIAAGLLIWALDRHPYGYYKMLRWIVCGVAGYITGMAINQQRYFWAILTGVFVIVFNPIISFHLDRDTWHFIDIIAAGEIITTIFFIKPTRS